MEAKTKDLWVFVETNPDGSAKNVGIELLTPGRMMADKQGGKLVALIIGDKPQAAIDDANAHGADEIIVIDGPEYKDYTTDAYAIAICAMVEKYGPTSMMIGATNNGRDLGPRVSCRLHTGLTADCTGLDIDDTSGIRRQPDGYDHVPGSSSADRYRPSGRVQEMRRCRRQSQHHQRRFPCG